MSEAFKKKYPFIDLRAEEIAGTDTYQRMLLEMKSGTASGWDVNYLTTDFYDDYFPYQKKFDVLGMAQQGVLQMPLGMIDPVNRNIVSYSTNTQVVAYNKKLIAENKVPSVWDDFLKPEFKGRKFLVDIRPQEVANLVPALGFGKNPAICQSAGGAEPDLDSRPLANARGHGRESMPMFLGANLNSTKRAMAKDRSGSLAYKVVEPVPIRIADHEAVFGKATSPYAGLLWLEFVASPETQNIINRDTQVLGICSRHNAVSVDPGKENPRGSLGACAQARRAAEESFRSLRLSESAGGRQVTGGGKVKHRKLPILVRAGLLVVVMVPAALLARVSPALQKAKQESESRGFLFETSRRRDHRQSEKRGPIAGPYLSRYRCPQTGGGCLQEEIPLH